MYNSRDRVLCALNHEEPDRVPIFFGTSGVTSMLSGAYEDLKKYLGIKTQSRLLSRAFQYARIDEEVMQLFGSDGRPLIPGPATSSLAKEVSSECFIDEWGITWKKVPDTLYYDAIQSPLCNASLYDLENYPWPDLADPSRFAGLSDQARAIFDQTGCAIVGMSGVAVFEWVQLLRGMETFMLDLAANREFAEALLRKVASIFLESLNQFMNAAGEYIDVLLMGDDLGTQRAPIISPNMYRSILKPIHAELISSVKEKSKAKIMFHSDGNIYPLIGDLIDVGVDLLNPVQVSISDMGDTARLKREFGSRLSFCGGIDTQWVAPYGSPEDVRREVRNRIKDLAPGGGYILASVHCIQPDVPIENVITLFEEAKLAGEYPLNI